jgi:hypothetical protein
MATTQRSSRRRLGVVLASSAAVGVLGAATTVPAVAHNDGHGDHRGRGRLSATLTGAKERPTPADPDGWGRAHVRLRQGQVCFTLSWQNIAAPVAAHIHKAPADQPGPVVVTLLSAPGGLGAPVSSVGGCAAVDSALVADIRQNPRAYYVNIHNADFPGGAIRGQLHR